MAKQCLYLNLSFCNGLSLSSPLSEYEGLDIMKDEVCKNPEDFLLLLFEQNWW